MPYPFAFHANFEAGSGAEFSISGPSATTDPGNRLDYPGPEQFRHDKLAVFPHRGGYCMRVNLEKNDQVAYVEQTVTWAADSVNFQRFEFMIGEDVEAGNNGDWMDIMTLKAGGTDEGSIVLARVEPDGMVIGLRDTGGGVPQQFMPVGHGDWLCLETQVDVDAGAGNDGSIVLFNANGRLRLSNLDQAPLTGVRYGAVAQSGDWKGHLYFDEIIHDTVRLYPDYGPHNLKLDGETMPFFKSGFAFIGQGTILGAQLIDAATGTPAAVLRIYDTDDLSFAEHMKKEHLATTALNTVAYSQPLGDGQYLFKVSLGCYVLLTGTGVASGAHALLRLGQVDELRLDLDDGDED